MDQDNRPAYVEFETRPVEDRAATEKEGRWIGKDVDFAIITPQGGNLVVERDVEEWLAAMKREDGPFLKHYKECYEKWKLGQDAPVKGTHVKNWPAISPAEGKLLLSVNILTVEDLAAANDSALERIGMGARALQNKARAWLETAENHGKTAEKLAALNVKLEAMEDTIKKQADELGILRALKEAKKTPRKKAA